MTSDDGTAPAPPPAQPHPQLKTLEPLVGTWTMTGHDLGTNAELTGRLSFEWMDGGFFLIQTVDVQQADGTTSRGLEVIGYDDADRVCSSHYFDSTGNHFSYVWELRGDALAIWFGTKGSPAGFTGTLADDGNIITGRWDWPGGGYSATMTRVAR